MVNNCLDIPGTVFVRVRVGHDKFTGQSSSKNVERDYKNLKENAIKQALHNAVLNGKQLSILYDDEIQNFSNLNEPYESVINFSDERLKNEVVKDNVEVLSVEVKYVGQKVKKSKKKPPKYISKDNKTKEGKKLITVKRENWKDKKTGKGKYKLVARDEKGRFKSVCDWSSKPSE